MAARVWTVTLGHIAPVAGTAPVIEAATDGGGGFLAVTLRDTTVGTRKDLIIGLQEIIRHLLSEQSVTLGQ